MLVEIHDELVEMIEKFDAEIGNVTIEGFKAHDELGCAIAARMSVVVWCKRLEDKPKVEVESERLGISTD